jgi:hypothetical protein
MQATSSSIVLTFAAERILDRSNKPMKRSLVLIMLVALFAAACGAAEPDDTAVADDSASIITVFRTPS